MKTDDIENIALSEMRKFIEKNDWQSINTLLVRIYTITDPATQANILNKILIMHGHEFHQEITKQLQNLAQPSSIPYIKQILENGFAFLDYTCSDDDMIAKWFSWALASIGTTAAIDIIEKFAQSENSAIAQEMQYRLKKTTPNLPNHKSHRS